MNQANGARGGAVSGRAGAVLGVGLALLVADGQATRAADECGAGATATCTSAGNPYPAGITYGNAGQTVTFEPGVVVDSTNGVALTGSGSQTVIVTPGAPGVSISSSAAGRTALDIQNATGPVTIDAGSASFSATGVGANGVQAINGFLGDGAISITTGNVSLGALNVEGYGVIGLNQAVLPNTVKTVSIDTSAGAVTTLADGGLGIYAQSFLGSVSVTSADISIAGNNFGGTQVNAIFANSGGIGTDGAVAIDTTAGAVALTGTTTSHAITATSNTGDVNGGGVITVTTGDVSTVSANANAINATTTGKVANGGVTVDTSAGTITTEGASARGILASSNSGAVEVTSADVDTGGSNAHGIQATSTGTVTVDSTAGAITTDGTNARGITVDKTGATATTIHAGTISTTGDEGQGIHVISGTFGVGNGGAVTITANSITTTGDSTGGTLGSGADGIEVITLGSGANGKIVIDTSVGTLPDTLGSVSTTGDRSRGIKAESGRPEVGGPIGGGAIEITAGNVSTEGLSASAIDAVTEGSGADGAITINVLGTISTKGDGPAGTDAGPARGINAVSFGAGGNVSVTAKDVSTEGDNATGIFAQSDGGTVTIDTTGGAVHTKGDGASGIVNGSPSGATMITTANVTTEGFASGGVGGTASGPNSALTIDTTAGDIVTLGEVSTGISGATGSFFLGQNAGLLTIRAGNVTTDRSGGISANANGGSIDIDTTAGTVHTKGLGGAAATGISATIGSAGGVATVETGSVQVDGDATFGQNYGVLVTSSGSGASGQVVVDTSAGTVTASGRNVRGIGATSQGGPIEVTAGAISAGGELGVGVFASTFGAGANGAVDLTVAGDVAATGEFGMGIFSFAGNNAGSTIDLTIAAGQSVMGGWQADPDLPGQFGAAAGVVVGGEAGVRSLASLVTNAGSIGAWSDLAIATADLGCDVLDPTNCPVPGLGYGWVDPGGGIEVQNTGTVTGYFRFGPGANLFHNNSPNSLDLRDFADTNGNGVRDTERVAIADMGGPGATFDNDSAGWLRLLSIPGDAGIDGAVAVDDASAILQSGVHDIDIVGIEQGHILNTATFRNAGTISMMDAETGGVGAVAGDVLVITGGGTAGVDGNGVFRSDGGALRIDVALNEGGANAQSDLLVVDGTEVGAGGATRVFVANAGGTGVQTVDDGIKIVDVLDPSASAAGAFALGANVAAGGFTYDLFQGGVLDASDGDWYLRSSGMRNAVPLYASAPSAALLYGTAMLGTLHQRIGEPQPASSDGLTGDRFSGTVAWGRVIHEAGENRNDDFDGHGPDFDYAFSGIETGIDLLRREHADGSEDVAGIYFGAGVGSADVDSLGEGDAGSVDFEGYSLGAYWTHFGRSGWYFDAVAQATYYAGMTAKSVDGDRLETSGWGVLASLEAGYPIPLPAGWRVEPQAQLIYQSVNLDGAADEVSRADFGRAEGLRGRLGLRVVKDWSAGDPARMPSVTTWLRANVWHEFLGESETTISDLGGLNPLAVTSDIGGTTGEVEIGLSATLSEHASAFATGHVAFALDGADRTGYGGRAGFRLEW